MTKLQAVILTGGSGTRFWPLSRMNRPKQFLPIAGERTMLEETVDRLLPLISHKNIFTISNTEQARFIKRLLPKLPASHILVEPQGKNTAASLILATARIFLQDPNIIVAALCADHLIRNKETFLKKLGAAAEAAAKNDVIVTFGVPPTFPAMGYGYIHFSKSLRFRIRGEPFYPVSGFKEKPGFELAKKYLADGRHFWNSGMFIYRAGVLADKLEKYAPSFYCYWQRIVRALKEKNTPEITAVFREIPALSIDYALMEKAAGILMIEGKFGWSDIGAWSSLSEVWLRDKDGNAVRGDGLLLDSRNCLVYSPRKLTALVGLKDVIVVDTADALLVCHKNRDQKVKEILAGLKKKGLKKYL
jgi:mannose-1-phosphate guanylyltransferase